MPPVLPTSQLHKPNALEAPAAWEASQTSRQDLKVRSSEIRRHFRLEARVKRDESLKGILLSPSTVSSGDESLDGTSISLEHLKQSLNGQTMPMLLFQNPSSVNSDCLGGLAERKKEYGRCEHKELSKARLTCRPDSERQLSTVAGRCATF